MWFQFKKNITPVLFFLVLTSVAQATTLLDVTSTVDPSDPTYPDLFVRNGLTSEWGTSKPYPGADAGFQTEYETFTVSAPTFAGPVFYEIELAPIASAPPETINIFPLAYQTSFDPTNLEANYLGDLGFSSSIPSSFRVSTASGSTPLVIVISASSSGPVTAHYELIVNAYSDTARTDLPASAPEPSSCAMVASVFGVAALLRKRLGKLSGAIAR